jgi:hypothetical protein
MVIKRSLIQIPLSFYNKLESILPESVKKSPGFVSIRSVEANLRSVCRSSAPRAELRERKDQGDPFENNEAMNDRVEVAGKGISIGGSSPPQPVNPTDYKSHWLKNASDEEVQARNLGVN